jgi:hypothetical protein
VPDAARALLTAALLSGSALAALAFRLRRTDPASPERAIGELQLSRWMAVLLAATGAMSAGLTIAAPPTPLAALEITIGLAFVGVAGFVLTRHPRQGLLVATGAFVLHALVDIAHRPGLLAPDLAPRWFTIGCAIYDICIGAVCYWARRR